MADSMKKKVNLCNYIIILNKRDNVGTALKDIPGGEYILNYDGNESIINIKELIRLGFKVSLYKIKKGELIFKYGNVIGVAKSDINPGDKVHIENIISSIKNE